MNEGGETGLPSAISHPVPPRRKLMGRPFPPGTSGNPSGRPKAVVAVQELAKEHTLDAIKALADVCRDEKAPPSARVAASTALLDRAWGRPSQAVEIGGSGVPIEGVLRIEFVKVDQIEGKIVP